MPSRRNQPSRQSREPLLSAVELRLTSAEFEGALIPYNNDEEFQALRDDPALFVYRQRGRPRLVRASRRTPRSAVT